MGVAATRDVRDSAVYEAVTAPYRRCPSPASVQRAEYADLKVYLPNDVLVKVDRMSMQHGLEVRSSAARSADRGARRSGFRSRSSEPEQTGKHLLKQVAAGGCPQPCCTLPSTDSVLRSAPGLPGRSRDNSRRKC